MSLTISSLVKCMFRRFTKQPTSARSRVSSARLSVTPLEDRVVPAVVFSDTYDWSGGSTVDATVTVTVTEDAPGYEGLLHWNYHLEMRDFAYPPLEWGAGMFILSVGDSTWIDDLSNSMGWDGYVGMLMDEPNVVHWQDSTYGDNTILPDGSADFSFTTPLRPVVTTYGNVSDAWFASGIGGPVATPGAPDFLPQAFDSLVTTSVNEDVDVTVLDFASDLDGDPLTVTGVTQGGNGTVVLNVDDTVTYNPDTDFIGDDSFTYTIEDQFGNESTGTVYVTVTAPVAAPTSVWTDEDTPINIDVLDLAFDPDGDELTLTGIVQGNDGTVTIELDGTVTYTPDTSFTGEDSFTYTVEDPDGNGVTRTITVTVGENDPVALDDSLTISVNAPLNVGGEDIAFDPSGGAVMVVAVTQGTHGTVVINIDGTFTYTPNNNYEGTDEFTYTVEDSNSNTATGTISVRVGTALPAEAEGIAEDLTELVNELDDFDGDTVDIVATAAPAIAASVDLYRGTVTSYANANNIEANGTGLSLTEFFELHGSYKKTLDGLNTLLSIESLLHSVLLANKAAIDELQRQLAVAANAAVPDKVLIQTLHGEIQLLITAQIALYESVHIPLSKDLKKVRDEAEMQYKALKMAAPQSLQPLITPPAGIPQRDGRLYIPKIAD